MAAALPAQTVYINSPESLQGAYTFAAASFGGALTGNIWTADAVFVDDGSANPNQGCNAPINAAEIAGKIALVDRGSCEFGVKCLNAENAGAIAVILFNNAPGAGPIVMGAGAVGGQVTIPCVSLSYEDGQTIRAVLANEPVNISIGSLQFANDLRLGVTNIANAPMGIVPSSQIKAAGDFVFTPGASALNAGLNAAPNLEVNAVITHTPFGGTAMEVYNETSSATEEILPDSTSALVTLPSFDPFSTGEGIYTVTYSISSDSTDDVGTDNARSSTFTVSEDLYSKASWNPATGAPRATISRTISGGGDIEFASAFNIPHGFGYKIDSVVFFVSTNLASLANVPVEAYIYEWNDADQDGAIINAEVAIVGLANFTFPEDFTATSASLRLPLLDFFTFEEDGVVIAEDNKDYILGVRYTGDDLVFFGFDDSYDYTQYQAIQIANGAFSDRDYGYLGINAWDNLLPNFEAAFVFTGVTSASAAGMILTSTGVGTQEAILGPDAFEVKLFPNPASEYLQVNLALKQRTSFVEYVITDMTGRLIHTLRDTEVYDTEQATFNIGQLPAGQYNLTIRTQHGIRTGSFVKR